jgi:uncharacterized membrane-anchored protein YhcB (DUF1043 family)
MRSQRSEARGQKSEDDVLASIAADTTSLRRSVLINRGIYTVIGLIVAFLVIQSFNGQARSDRNYKIATEAFKVAVEAKASQIATQNQLVDYIERMTQVIDKLERDNQDVIKVPVAPASRPKGLPAQTDKDLDRPKAATPTPSATPIVKIIKVPGPVRYRKPPSFWDKILKPSSTPRRKR